MNKLINALLISLDWEKNKAEFQKKNAQQNTVLIKKEIHALEHSIDQKKTGPLNPELEQNAFYFRMQQHHKKEGAMLKLQEAESLITVLQTKLQQIKTELKILNHYQEKQKKHLKKGQQQKQEHILNEWILQHHQGASYD